jgi:hypothetical protein
MNTQQALTKRLFYETITTIICLFLVATNPSPLSAHTAPCLLASSTTEAIMAYNACKAESQAGTPNTITVNTDTHQQEAEIQRLQNENERLRAQLDTVRMTLFELIQKLTTQ